MKDFEALKNIWHGQVALPKVGYEDVLKQVRRTKRRFANKILFDVIAMAAAIAILSSVWILVPFKMWTTHLSMLIFVICCLYYILTQVNYYRRISTDDLMLGRPEDYIVYLKEYKNDRYILNTRKYRVYTTFISFGFAFYFIEIFFLSTVWITIAGILFTIAWIFVSYYVFMRRQIRKEEASLGEMIDNLERLRKQFKDDSEA